EGRAAAIGLVLLTLGIVPLLTPWVWLVCVGMAVMGVGIPLVVVAFVTLRQRATPDELQGRAAAAGNVALNLPQTLVSIIGAGLLLAVDHRVLLVATIVVVLVGVILALRVRQDATVAAEAV